MVAVAAEGGPLLQGSSFPAVAVAAAVEPREPVQAPNITCKSHDMPPLHDRSTCSILSRQAHFNASLFSIPLLGAQSLCWQRGVYSICATFVFGGGAEGVGAAAATRFFAGGGGGGGGAAAFFFFAWPPGASSGDAPAGPAAGNPAKSAAVSPVPRGLAAAFCSMTSASALVGACLATRLHVTFAIISPRLVSSTFCTCHIFN